MFRLSKILEKSFIYYFQTRVSKFFKIKTFTFQFEYFLFTYYSPDTLLEGWTLRLDGWTLGLEGWTLGLEGWTLGLEGWTLAFEGWIFYFHELFICLIFSLLKVIPATSDLYNLYCLTVIIYNV